MLSTKSMALAVCSLVVRKICIPLSYAVVDSSIAVNIGLGSISSASEVCERIWVRKGSALR